MLCGHYVGNKRRPHRRVALALGIDPSIALIQMIGEIMVRMSTPLKPVEVATGPVKEVIKMGKEPETIPTRVTFEDNIPVETQKEVIRKWNEVLKLKPEAWTYRKE